MHRLLYERKTGHLPYEDCQTLTSGRRHTRGEICCYYDLSKAVNMRPQQPLKGLWHPVEAFDLKGSIDEHSGRNSISGSSPRPPSKQKG